MTDVTRGHNFVAVLDLSIFIAASPLPRCISASRRAYVSYISAVEREFGDKEIFDMLLMRHRVQIREISGKTGFVTHLQKNCIKLVLYPDLYHL